MKEMLSSPLHATSGAVRRTQSTTRHALCNAGVLPSHFRHPFVNITTTRMAFVAIRVGAVVASFSRRVVTT